MMIYYIFSREIPGFIHSIKLISSQAVIFTLKISKVLFSKCENNRLLRRHVMYCMQFLRYERNMVKNQRKYYEQKIK